MVFDEERIVDSVELHVLARRRCYDFRMSDDGRGIPTDLVEPVECPDCRALSLGQCCDRSADEDCGEQQQENPTWLHALLETLSHCGKHSQHNSEDRFAGDETRCQGNSEIVFGLR